MDADNSQGSPLSRWRIIWTVNFPGTVQPTLNCPVGQRYILLFKSGTDARQVRGVGLGRAHVLGWMLKRIDIHGQAVVPGVAIITEFSGQYRVEQFLASAASAIHCRAAIGAWTSEFFRG